MMWGAALIFLSCVAVQVTSHEINVECREFNAAPPSSNTSPSFLADLNVALVTVGGKDMMNISWAVNIDGSINNLAGTRIIIEGESPYHCQYRPALAEANLNVTQKWFHYLVKASHGLNSIQAANLPLPPPEGGLPYKFTTIVIPRRRVTSKPTTVPIVEITSQVFTDLTEKVVPGNVNFTSLAVGIFGALAGLMILSCCYIIYKSCGANFATSLGFKRLPTAPLVPVPVLVVYPAENSAFQRAVVAMTEFLQWHGGCSVAVDMWQQGKIAELGPMRWLAEQAKAAHRVLVVCPQPSSQHSHSPLTLTVPETSIPAAAHDLYPLILNMVASQAKSASDLAKFLVVQLGEQQEKKACNLPLELRACKTFCLMKDLSKLCRSLHTQSQDGKKISDLILRPGVGYNEKCTVKLREAVERLGGHQPSLFREVDPLKSVVSVV